MKKNVLMGIIAFLVFVAYSNTFQSSFHWEDFGYIVNNAVIKDLGLLLKDWNVNRFVGLLTFWANFELAGLEPWMYHLTNISLHIMNSVLVFLLLELLFRLVYRDIYSSYQKWMAFFGALLFGLHPLNTQAVTYISQRFVLLSALFYLSSVYLYLKARVEVKAASLISSLISCVLAMKTNETAFTLPFVIILSEYLFFRDSPRRPWKAISAFLLCLLIIPLGRTDSIRDFSIQAIWSIPEEAGRIPVSQYFPAQMKVILTYLRLLVFPVSLSIDYDYPVPGSLFDPDAFLSALIHLGLIITAVFLITKKRSLILTGMGILWYYITLSVESSIIPSADVIFEHRVYLPSLGFLLAVITMLPGFIERYSRQAAVLGCIIMLAFGILSFQRNSVWATEKSLWGNALETAPKKIRTLLAYAGTLKPEDAVKIYERILSYDPMNLRAMDSLAKAQMEKGKIAEAEEILKRSGKILKAEQTSFNLADLHIKKGEYGKALGYLREVIALNPDNFFYFFKLGYVYEALGNPGEAEKAYRKAIELNPSDVDSLNNLGNLMADSGDFYASLSFLEMAAKYSPKDASIWANIGATYAQLKDYDEALRSFDKAIAIDPKLAEAWYNKSQILWGAGKREAAIFAIKKAISLKQDYQQAKDTLRAWQGG